MLLPNEAVTRFVSHKTRHYHPLSGEGPLYEGGMRRQEMSCPMHGQADGKEWSEIDTVSQAPRHLGRPPA